MLTRLAVCAGMAAARLGELVYSRRNLEGAGRATEGEWGRRTYPFIVAVHTAAIAGTALTGSRRASSGWLVLLLGVQPLRLWVLATLGRRWNTRGAVPEDTEVETGGPYAYVRHPNYAVIIVELLALPMAFGCRRLALAVTAVNAALLAIRIRDEERALMRLPGYRAHFGRRKRLVPGIL